VNIANLEANKCKRKSDMDMGIDMNMDMEIDLDMAMNLESSCREHFQKEACTFFYKSFS
jgi:hypothetical protein